MILGEKMKRVVISGMGLVSPLGNNKEEALISLRETKSGIKFQEEYKEKGLRSHVAGSINLNTEELIDRKLYRFMADGHAYAWIAMQEAISDAKLSEDQVSNIRTGIIVGAGGTSTESMLQGSETLKEKGIRRVGPYMVTKTMSNGVSACLATMGMLLWDCGVLVVVGAMRAMGSCDFHGLGFSI